MQVKTQRDELENYLIDASNLQNGHAEKLYVPETKEEIAEILKEANEKKIPVTVSGARTGTVGGAIPFGGWIISLEKLNKIKEINEDFCIVGSGVILTDLQKAVEAKNLFIRPIRPSGVVKSAARLRRTRAVRGVLNTARLVNMCRDWKSFWQTAKL